MINCKLIAFFWHISFCSKCTLMYFFHVLKTFNNIRKGKYARFMNMFLQHFKSCTSNKRLKKYPLTLNGIKTWCCLLLAKDWRWALCICHVFGLQMIFETRRTSIVTLFMSTVHADNFCPINRTMWQCFESEFAVH